MNYSSFLARSDLEAIVDVIKKNNNTKEKPFARGKCFRPGKENGVYLDAMQCICAKLRSVPLFSIDANANASGTYARTASRAWRKMMTYAR